jgi:hypothetical protein
MATVGTATLNFGSFPGSNEASVAVTGQGTITTGSVAEAYFMADSTSDHTASDHAYAPTFIELTCGALVNGTGFTIYGRSAEKMQGTFQVRWVWS